MMRNSKYIVMALGAVVLLAGCNSKSPTAPKPTPIPALNITLTPASSTATTGNYVAVTAQVNSGSGNAPDGTTVTFDVGGGHFDVRDGTGAFATEVVRTTSGGHAIVNITADNAGPATVLGRVSGDSDQTTVTFSGVAPTPTPTAPPDYTPQIYVLTPNAGPFEGGTRVTISGTGFQAPVQVLFDDVQAQVVSTAYTEIVCISPNIAPTQPPSDASKTVSVTVTNIGNGKKSNGVDFRYGVGMFISSFTPMEGPADAATTVTIFGQGFVAPVNVVAVASVQLQWDVLSVAGTEIVAKSKPIPESARACADVPATLTVTNVNSNTSATATNPFTYRAVHPLITSVQLAGGGNTVLQYVPVAVPPSLAVCPTPWSSYSVTVKGSGFQQGMTVSFGGQAPIPATFVDANTLTLAQLPDLTSVSLATIQCTTGSGACGSRFVPTQVSVTVDNPHNGCSDTLNGAIVINPCDQSCLLTGLTSMSLGAVVGTPQVGSTFTIPLNFTPTPLTTSATVSLTYVGFTATPGQVTIPPSASPYPIIVTPTTAGSGSIIATVGSGSCAITASSGVITVIAAAPTVTSVAPPTGPAAGGTAVTITGTNFQSGATVTFGGNPATGVTFVNSTTITCNTPAGAVGAVNVVVTNPDTQFGTLVNGFTYT